MITIKPIWALGAMSGTSLDGIDGALLYSDGQTIHKFGPTCYSPYSPGERARLHAALGRWPGDDGVHDVACLVEEAHIAALRPLCADAPVDLIGFHGQTLAHDPSGRGTHQAGDGAVLAQALNIPVIWDFRTQDVAQGGQGAPLVPFFHFACAKWAGLARPAAFLNLGGVGNITWVDPAQPAPESPMACLACDTGPANAPINDLMMHHYGLPCDEGGQLALQGRVHHDLIDKFTRHPFFAQQPPKSLDRDAFANLFRAALALAPADGAATLTYAAAKAVALALNHFPCCPERIIISGGGRHNRALMACLTRLAPCPILQIEEMGLNGDMLEAQAFAFLAIRSLYQLPLSGPTTTGVPFPATGGRTSRPKPSGKEPA